MKQKNKNVVGEKCIQDDNGILARQENAWKQHYERLLNVEFHWREEDLSTVDTVIGPTLFIIKEMVVKVYLQHEKQ